MPTALEFLHALAEESGEHGSFTTTASGSTTSLICSKLANSGLSATEFSGMHVLVESGAAQGEVAMAKSLTRSTGALATWDALSATIVSDVTFSLYELLPPIDGDGVIPSYLKIVNWALRRLTVERTISFSGVTGQVYYTVDQATHPWWTDTARILWIQAPTAQAEEVPRRLRPESWDWDTDGETKRLILHGAPFKTGDTFTVKVGSPGNARLKKNGTWTNQSSQTAGLSLFTNGVADEALPDVADVVTVGIALMFRALSRIRQPTAEIAEWLTKAQPSFRAASALLHADQPEDWTAGITRLRPVRVGYRGR